MDQGFRASKFRAQVFTGYGCQCRGRLVQGSRLQGFRDQGSGVKGPGLKVSEFQGAVLNLQDSWFNQLQWVHVEGFRVSGFWGWFSDQGSGSEEQGLRMQASGLSLGASGLGFRSSWFCHDLSRIPVPVVLGSGLKGAGPESRAHSGF
jgi:hypothetical protein